MRKFLTAAFAVLFLCSICSCATAIIGAGTGAGIYTYIKGELVRSYPVKYAKAISESEAVAKELKITIDTKDDDGIVCTMKGARPDGTPVTIRARMIDLNITQIGVRVGVVGLWDRNISELVHKYLARRI